MAENENVVNAENGEVKNEEQRGGEEKKQEQPQVQQHQTTQQQKKKYYFRKKVCRLCKQRVESISYKDIELLQRFLMPSGKIIPRRMSGNCARHQKMVARAIKRARILALLPFTDR